MMRLRTAALAVALVCASTPLIEAKQKPRKVKVQNRKPPKHKTPKVKRPKTA